MPIYEYRCDACGTVFEEWHKHADDIMEQPCPACNKEAHRLISNTSFVLKGGGWYVTEYGNRKADSTSGAAAPATPDESPATEASSGSSEGTSAPKAESTATAGAGAKPAASAAAD